MAILTYVTLPVNKSDLLLVRDWYLQVIGLSVVWESDDFVLLAGENGARPGLHTGTPLSEPGKVQLHFKVIDADVDEVYTRLKNQGVIFLQGPTDTPWGYRVASLYDPIGHMVELYSE